MLRNREALGLDAGQVLTLELKESELQLRLAARLEALGKRSGAGRGGGPGGGAGGPPGGGGGGGEMGGPGGGGMGGGGGQGMGLQGGVSPEGVQAGLTLPGVPGGGPSVSSGPGAAGGGAAPDAALAELAALDRAAVDGVRMIFRPEQLPGVDRLVALRAEALARRGPHPDRPPEGSPPPAAPK